MPFEKGQSGNPAGPALTKPFRDALRMELAAAGEDHKALRRIARNLIELASIPDAAAMPAIKEVADRTDGKVPQGTGQDPELGPSRTEITWKSAQSKSTTPPADNSSPSTTEQNDSPASSPTGEPEKQ